MANTSSPWTTLSCRVAYESGWLKLEDRTVRDATGRERPYGVVRFKHVGLCVLPIDRAGFTYLVGQHRYAADYYSWELPAGGAEPGDGLLESAKRELREEVGLAAEHWIALLDMIPSGSLTDERQVGYLAWDFEEVDREPDPQEVLTVRRLPFRTALEMALAGDIRHAASIALLATAKIKADRQELPPELIQRLR